MKRGKKFFGILAASAMILSLVIPVQAAPQNYTYTVRVFAGKQGNINGGSVVEAGNVSEGFVTFRQKEDSSEGFVELPNGTYDITLPEDSKYYVKGIKKSGEDKISNSAGSIMEDVDYVVVYGIKGERVKYTVNYVDTNGNELAKSGSYLGNVGDKPIVAYLHIEGYMPNAYNITKTLSKNEAENVFTFYYTRITVGTGGGGGSDTTITTEEVETTTNTTPVVIPGGNTGGAAGADGGVTVVPGEGAGETAEAGAGEAVQGPQELVDLDDEEVPLANVPGGNESGLGITNEPGSFFVNMPPAVIVGIVSMAVLFVAAVWVLLFKRKKKGTEEDEQK